MRRIEALDKPDHRALRRLLTGVHRECGTAILVDCHSMPSIRGGKEDRPRADFVLGDRYGTSCSPLITQTLEEALRDLGYAVGRNKPYAGGFITEHYGAPGEGLHAVQIEVNRALYMDERCYERSASFGERAGDIVQAVEALADIPLEQIGPYRAAAE